MNTVNMLERIWAQINLKQHIIGVAAGSGISAKFSVLGGADFILALSAGKFRQMGRSSLASYLSYSNSNEVVMTYATKELLPLIQETPIIFGINANDPSIHLYDYLEQIKENGFAGINNFPSVGMIDGKFKEALNEEGITYDREVEAMKMAKFLGMTTVAFVFDEEQAKKMVAAQADIICAHFGLTAGGMMGAKKTFSLEHAKILADRIFSACANGAYQPIKMVYGGPASTPIDMQYLYDNTECMGYIGGSSVERIPTERSIVSTTRAFKCKNGYGKEDLLVKILDGNRRSYDYVGFVKNYIHKHYSDDIRLKDLALVANVSYSYLSTLFKKEIGCSFSEYLVKFRVNKAAEIILSEKISFLDVAMMVGYHDYSQFSKIFKKYKGLSPKNFRESNINT